MNRGFLYLTLGAIAIALALLSPFWWLALFFIWVAMAAVYFGIGYLSGYGEILLKSSQGRLPGVIKAILFPILIVTLVYNYFMRQADPNPPVQKIREGLYLGRRLFPTDIPLLKETNIGAILDVTVEFDALGSKRLSELAEYLNIPVFDHSRPRSGQLHKAIRWIHEQRREGKNVLIHCALGQGRSVAVLLGYLIFLERSKSLQEHMESIKEVRTTAQPNRQQLAMLEKFRQMHFLKKGSKAALIFNPVAGSGNGEKDLKRIREILDPFLNLKVYSTTKETGAEALVKEALKDNPDLVIASGGDGTLSEVAHALSEMRIPLGIIPRGTANALALALYGGNHAVHTIPRSCDRILRGYTANIDLIKINQKDSMILLAGVGFEAKMVEKAEREQKDKWGPLAYLAGGWESLTSTEEFSYQLEIDGKSVEGKAQSIVIANCAPPTSVFAQGGGSPDPFDGEMDITVVEKSEKTSESVGTVAHLFAKGVTSLSKDVKNQKTNDNFSSKHYKGKIITLSTNPDQNLVVDGELKGASPVRFEIIPSAMRIFVDEQSER